eukprot:7199037-Prymnesium_polylepis.1
MNPAQNCARLSEYAPDNWGSAVSAVSSPLNARGWRYSDGGRRGLETHRRCSDRLARDGAASAGVDQ